MKHILVAGGSGNIGSFLKKTFSPNDFIFISSKDCDLISNDSIKEYFTHSKKFDILIYLVGLAHRKGKKSDLNEFNNVNYETLVNLLTFLGSVSKLPDKIIFASTTSVYGEKYDQIIYDENTMPKPFSPYAITKLKAEEYLLKNYSERSWIIRFASSYSPEFLINIYRRTKIGGRFYKVGKGVKKLSLCSFENIRVAFQEIVNENVPIGVYNLSDTKHYSYNELLAWQGASFTLRVPKNIVKILYYFGKLFGNNFLKENTIKLLTDNIYPNNKITAFIELPYVLNDVQQNHSGIL